MPGTKTMYGFTTHSTALPLGYLSREDTFTTTAREEGSLIYLICLDLPTWVLVPGKSPEA